MLMITVVAAVCLAAGCTSTSDPAQRPAVLTVAEPANGATVRVAVGSQVRVTLHSTYWHFANTSGVLRRSALTTQPDSSAPRIPGSGRGTVVSTFLARSAGTATIRATRTSCGEALRCVGAQGTYRLTVVVG